MNTLIHIDNMAVSVLLRHANSQPKIHVTFSAQLCRPQDLLDDPSHFGVLKKTTGSSATVRSKKKVQIFLWPVHQMPTHLERDLFLFTV